jgi:hypothetical protein
MTPLEIATAVFAAQGVSDADKVEVKNMSLGIHRNLKRRAGKVVERLGEGTPAKWRLTTYHRKFFLQFCRLPTFCRGVESRSI